MDVIFFITFKRHCLLPVCCVDADLSLIFHEIFRYYNIMLLITSYSLIVTFQSTLNKIFYIIREDEFLMKGLLLNVIFGIYKSDTRRLSAWLSDLDLLFRYEKKECNSQQ